MSRTIAKCCGAWLCLALWGCTASGVASSSGGSSGTSGRSGASSAGSAGSTGGRSSGSTGGTTAATSGGGGQSSGGTTGTTSGAATSGGSASASGSTGGSTSGGSTGSSSGGSTVDLCGSLPSGTAPIAYSPLAQPAVGAAATDPDFGTAIYRVTDVVHQLGAGANTATPVYPPVASWNIDESRLIFYVRGASCDYALYDGHRYASAAKPSYAFIGCVPGWDSAGLTGFDPNGTTGNPEEFRWDVADPDVLWWVDDQNRLLRYHVSTNADDVAFAAADQIATHGYYAWSGDLFGMGSSNGFSLALSGGSWTKSATTVPMTGGDAPVACPSGSCLVASDSSGAMTVYGVDMAPLRTMTMQAEHGDLGLDSAGNDYWATVQFGSPEPFDDQLVVEWLRSGQTKVVIPTSPQSNTLVSAKALKLRGWVAGNSTGNPSSSAGYLPTTTTFDQEIFLANVETGAYCRVAHHRALGKAVNTVLGYFAQPQTTFSPSGTRIVFNSDWGVGSGAIPSVQETYVVELPSFVPSP